MPIDRQERLRKYLELISRSSGGLESLAAAPAPRPRRRGAALESTEGAAPMPAAQGQKADDPTLAKTGVEAAKKIATGKDLSHREMVALEAIIIPDKRPAFDVVNGDFVADHPLWTKLTTDAAIHQRLLAGIPRVGRIELLNQNRIPFGGTGFVVGDGLLMTNRHVAEIFARGIGTRGIRFHTAIRPGLDLKRERGGGTARVLDIRRVRMIHPWWDMALLEVDGLPSGIGSVRLSTRDARDLVGREVAVIGYPAYDPLRNDPDVQNELFDRTYGVKRLQPGAIAAPARTESFGKLVDAAAHDCSTLGGNSGSLLMDLESGDVLALHFGGRYLDTNYCVPASELARDSRVRDAGVQFAGTPPGGAQPSWLSVWNSIEASMQDGGDGSSPDLGASPAPAGPPPPPRGTVTTTATGGAGRITFEVPLRITVELGIPSRQETATAQTESVAGDFTEAMREPAHETDYRSRRGYNPQFLTGQAVPMPEPQDRNVLAPLKRGGNELKYQNFSILMHAERRLALFTASNITREAKLRKPEPGRDYTRKGLSGLGENDTEKWFPDSRLDPRYQLPDVFFTKDAGAFDKGHIVRREDVAWGQTYDTLRRANGDTYHVTNCSPQVSQFNQSARGEDNWGDLENLVMSQAAAERLNVFAGPVLDNADRIFVGRGDGGSTLRVKVPSRYWKVVVAPLEDGIAAYGFVLEQDLSDVALEFAVPENFRHLQVRLSEIEELAGIAFDDAVRGADTFDDERGLEVAWRGGLERVESVARPDASDTRPTPNSGDDAEAEPGAKHPLPEATEAPAQWRVAKSLLALKNQVNAMAPRRSRASDGTIGDAAHATRNSDHNPWVRDGAMGVVTAMDITHDAAGGCDAGRLAETIVANKDKRVKYVIWNRKIANSASIGGAAAWTWRPYNGSNPHNKHCHISVKPVKGAYDDETPWQI